MNIVEALVILLLLVAVSAFVSCSELALASSRKIKLQILGKEGDVRALDVLQMQEQPGSFITVVQIGLNAVAILAGVVGEAAVRPYLGALLQRFSEAAWVSTLASILSFCSCANFSNSSGEIGLPSKRGSAMNPVGDHWGSTESSAACSLRNWRTSPRFP